MNNKERTLKAIDIIIGKYLNQSIFLDINNQWIGLLYFHNKSCALCDIHYKGINTALDYNDGKKMCCKGCPLSDKGGKARCIKFATYIKANEAFENYHDFTGSNGEVGVEQDLIKAFKARANFFKKIIPILEKEPVTRFTRTDWKFFDMIEIGEGTFRK